MKNTTLCYIENPAGEYLMLHRVKKENDCNHDKWIGVGGKFEDGESPEECVLRETLEETGLTLTDYRYRGIVTFASDRWETEYMHLFTATSWTGRIREDCDEGVLEWIHRDRLAALPQWEGDRIFLELLRREVPFFSLKLCYQGDTLIQAVLNGLADRSGDAVKWWDAGMHPSFLFIDEYVALRAIFPSKAAKDDPDYCLASFDGLLRRIVTMGASAGCFVIISIAEASVQEGGLPAMLRSAMSTKVLFRPTLPEGRLMWDSDKLADFSAGRVYGPGDAWFSSTDGIHDAVSFIHFPHMQFPVYKELGRLLQEYYD